MKRFLLLALCSILAALPSVAAEFRSTQESGGTFAAGQQIRAGMTRHGNVVPGSLQIVAGDYCVWCDDGAGHLVFFDLNSGAKSTSGTIQYASGAWTILVNPAMARTESVTVRYSYYVSGGGRKTVAVEEPAGPFPRGRNVFFGKTEHPNVIPGSFQVSAGGFVWNDDGNGRLVFTDPYGGASSEPDVVVQTITINGEAGPATTTQNAYAWNLKNCSVVPGSVTVSVAGSGTFRDSDKGGVLKPNGIAGTGSVNYDTGTVTIVFDAPPGSGRQFTVSYSYTTMTGPNVVLATLSGSGTIQYSSGAWTVQVSPSIPDDARTVVRYSYREGPVRDPATGRWIATAEQTGGTFGKGKRVVSGRTARPNVVPGSLQFSAGGYVWNDDGNGKLVFTDPIRGSASESATQTITINGEAGATTSSKTTYTWSLQNRSVVPGSVTIALAGAQAFHDDGNGCLNPMGVSGNGTINYTTGTISIVFSVPPGSGKALTVSYTAESGNTTVNSEGVAGSGAILYASGAWVLQITPAMAANAPVRIVYGYYTDAPAEGADDGAAPARTAFGDQVKVGKRKWSFDANPDGKTCTVVGVFPANGALKIPAKLGGLTVTGIDGDFLRNPTMTALSIPAGVREIGGGPGACAALRSLKVAAKNKTFKSSGGVLLDKRKTKIFGVVPAKAKYTIPASVAWIAEDAFGPKTAVSVAKKNKKFTVSGGVLYDKTRKTVLHCPKARKGTVKLPASATAVGAGAFRDCAGVKKVVLGKKVARIGEDAFRGCTGLAALGIPASVSAIEGNPFASSGLKTVKVASGNACYAAAGGLLLSKDKRTLVAAPFGGKGPLKIPKAVVRIGRGAFDGRAVTSFSVAAGHSAFKASGGVLYSKDGKTLVAYPAGKKKTAFKIPAAVETVRGHAFADCAKLAKVVVPAGVKRIERAAFGSENRKPGTRKLSLPNRAVCDVARQRLPASCKVVYKNTTPAYRIRLSANGGAAKNDSAVCGTGADGSPFVDLVAFRGKAAKLPACPFERRGRVFGGWATKPGGAAKFKNKAAVKNLAASGRVATLYAVWRSARTVWRFDANGGAGTTAPVVDDYGKWTAKAPACGFRRAGATFDRWNTKPDASGRDYLPGDPLHGTAFEADATATLYAIWMPDDTDEAQDADTDENAPASSEAAPDAAPAEGVVFGVADDVPWTEVWFDGEPCFESGAAGDGGKSTLLASVEGSGTLAFCWRTSSEEGRDIVFFSLDGADVSSRSGLDEDWASLSLRIEGDGPHVLSWTYAKDASGSAGDDRARLADVVWLPD